MPLRKLAFYVNQLVSTSLNDFFLNCLKEIQEQTKSNSANLRVFNGPTIQTSTDSIETNIHSEKAIITRSIYFDEKESWIPLLSGDKVCGLIGLLSPKERPNQFVEQLINLIVARILSIKKELPNDSFISNMSHELRNPLNGLLGYLQILESSGLNSAQQGYLYSAQKCGLSLIRVVNDILDYSKLMSGKMKLNVQITNLYDLLGFVEETLHISIQEKGHTFTLFFHPDVPKMILTDSQKLAQICINLLSNAIKFTPAKGKINFEVNLMIKEKEYLIFKIADTGCGISKIQSDELFRTFTRLHHSREEGTGLGLVISKKLTELLSGTIRLEKSSSEGSEFVFEIPLQRAQEVRSSQLGFKKEVCLFVSEKVQTELNPLLLRWGMKVFNVQSFSELLTILSSYVYDFELVILEDGEKEFEQNSNKIWEICPKIPIIHACKILPQKKSDSYFHLLNFTPTELYNCIARALENSLYLKKKNSIRLDLKKKILIAEDDPSGREILSRLLQSIGFSEIDCAEDGLQALNMIQKKSYSYLFIDLKMPVIDGYEVITTINKKPNKTMKLICVSASVTDEDKQFCQKASVPFLAKPVQFRNLQDLMVSLS